MNRRRWAAVSLATVLTLAATGCATPRAALGTSQSACFPALAVAAETMAHNKGRFAGVTRIGSDDIPELVQRFGPLLPRRRGPGVRPSSTTTTTHSGAGSASGALPSSLPSSLPAPLPSSLPAPLPALPGASPSSMPSARGTICLVAYRGHFDAAHVPLIRGPNRTGNYAVVVVGVQRRRALAVFLTDQLPKAFRHL